MAEFRWILLGIGLFLIAGIWAWGRRRSSQAPGDAALREASPKESPRLEPEAEAEPDVTVHEWEISPFEPLSIKTADFGDVPILDGPMMVDIEEPREPEFLDDAETIPNERVGPVMPPVLTEIVPAAPLEPIAVKPPSYPSSDASDRIATRPPSKPSTSEKQKIVSVRVCAPAAARWSGSSLLSALETHGLAHGRYQVFHRRHLDGRSLFCVASLVEPGTFDVSRMPQQEFKGITLFAVLPGPVDSLLTFDEMLSAARGLAGELPGTVQDAKGVTLSLQGLAELREDVVRFQATLPVS